MRYRILASCLTLVAFVSVGQFALGQTAGPKPVVLTDVVEQSVSAGKSFVGTINPTRRATIGSAVDGRVVEFPIEIGDRVEKGETLAQVLTDTIRLELANAEAQLKLRREELRELENGARPEEIDQAIAKVRSAEATHKYSQARLERTESLLQRGGVTEQNADEIRSLAAASEQALEEAEANRRLVVAGPREEQIAQARAQLAMQQAVVDRLKEQLDKYTIQPRFTGYVVTEHTEAGAWVNQGDPIAEIVALDQVDVEAYIPEAAISFVRVGTEIRVDVPALPDRSFSGKVVAINPQADVQTRTFPVLVRITNEIKNNVPTLKAGMLAHVSLATAAKKRAILVPKDALVLGTEKPQVYVASPHPDKQGTFTVNPVHVTLGLAHESLIEIIGGPKPGQKVVSLGNEGLRPGDIVKPIPRDEEG